MEEWRDIKGYEGLYQVSNEGRVRSLDREIVCNTRWGGTITYTKKGTILTPAFDSDGYLFVNLKVGGKQHTKKLHRLIGEAFIPNPSNFPEIDHINTIRDDNRIENMRWCTHEMNCRNQSTLENIKSSHQTKSKKTYQYTIEGELVATYNSTREASKKTGFSPNGIICCCNGGFFSKERNKWVNCKTYKGYRWSREPL